MLLNKDPTKTFNRVLAFCLVPDWCRFGKCLSLALMKVDINTDSLFFYRINILRGVKPFAQHETLKIARVLFFFLLFLSLNFCVHPRIKHSSAPAEGREAAICHGLCPVLCLVSVVAAELWIMTPVGRWEAVWQPCLAPLPGRSPRLSLHPQILNFGSKEQWSWSPGDEQRVGIDPQSKLPTCFSITQYFSED